MKFIPFLLCLMILFSGCSKTISNPQTIMPLNSEINAVEIKIFMSRAGFMPDSYIVVDKFYECTTEDYIKNDYSVLFNKFLFDFKQSQYSASNNDCDKFSLSNLFFSNNLYSNAKHKSNHSLAVGEFGYTRWDGINHDICFYLVKDGGNISIFFYDPEIKKIVTLTDTELKSCFYWRI